MKKNSVYKNLTVKTLLLFIILLFSNNGFSQADSISSVDYFPYYKNIIFNHGGYLFESKYDTTNWCSVLSVKYKGKEVANTSFDGWIDTINAFDFNNNKKNYILIGSYTGGAHCCVMLFLGVMKNEGFYISDTLFLGNAWYNIEDIEGDGILELNTSTDMFAYAFTNYAETRFPPRVYIIKNDRFKDATEFYPNIVNGYIGELMEDLKEFTSKGFDCPEIDEDTFNTDAGSVKTILAAITACYYSIGKVEKGYELIDKTYKCPDKGKFIKILKDDFKLK